MFIEPGCGPCEELLPDVSGWQSSHAEKLAIAVVSRGQRKPNRATKRQHRLTVILMQKDGETADAYQCPGTPGALIVNADGTIVLFWNPGCGFCQEILDKIKAWESKRRGDGSRLLVVSDGTVEDNRAQGFRSPVVLDRDFSAGNMFGAAGTPCAVLVDKEGKIASDVAVGSEQVLKLMTT